MAKQRRFLNPNETPPPAASAPSATQMEEFRATTQELALRRLEALRLYEPLGFQQKYHASTAKELVLRKGNQIGGTLCGAVEVARAVTGRDPYGKYPAEGGMVACLGFGESHIGKTFYPALFMAGQFKIIPDAETGQWRTFRPWADADRESLAKPAPPLIPKRFVKHIAWENKSKRIFSRVDFITGWTLSAFNTSGLPSHAQGFKGTLIWIDEDTDKEGWYDEMIARLSMSQTTYGCKGYLRWTAMPHGKNEDMVKLLERAEDQDGDPNAQSVVIGATVFDNPYYPKEALADNIRIWKSAGEDVYRKRALGVLTTTSQLMYPGFNKDLHNVRKTDEPRLPVQEAYMKAMGEPPADWCLYAVIDPGHSICAVTYYCVPPPSLGDFVICYAEDYLAECDAVMFANAFEKRAKNRVFQAFIIDAHGGRIRELGSGIMPREQYSRQLKERGIQSVQTRHGFIDGCDDIEGREGVLRQWLGVRRDGTTKLLIDTEQCPNLVREIQRFKKLTARVNGAEIVTDKGNRKNTHAVETLEYAVAHGLAYVRPPVSTTGSSWLDRVLENRRSYEKRLQMRGMGRGPRHITLGPQGV